MRTGRISKPQKNFWSIYWQRLLNLFVIRQHCNLHERWEQSYTQGAENSKLFVHLFFTYFIGTPKLFFI